MSHTTIYAVVERCILSTCEMISLTPMNIDGHDLRNITCVQELVVPYDIKEDNNVIVISKRDKSCVCSVVPYSTYNYNTTKINDDEILYTTYIPLNSWYGVR